MPEDKRYTWIKGKVKEHKGREERAFAREENRKWIETEERKRYKDLEEKKTRFRGREK